MDDPKERSCHNEGCEDGFILVYNAYSENPLVGQKEPCDVCNGIVDVKTIIH